MPYLMHNKINTSTKQVPTLSELFKKARTQAALEKTASSADVVKTASVAEPAVKEAGKGVANFGDKKAPPFGAKGKKDEKGKEEKGKGEEKDACPCTSSVKQAEKEQDEAETSGQPQVEAKLVNDPKLPEGEEKGKGGKAKSDKDEAETSGQPQAEAKLVNKPEVKDSKEARTTIEGGRVKMAKWVRVAELSSKQKTYLRKVYEIYWPKEFVDALLASQ